MGSLYKRNGIYQAKYYSEAEKKWKSPTTKTRDRKAAQACLAELER